MDAILVVNAGSSSLKFRLYSVVGGGKLLPEFGGQLDGIGVHPRLRARSGEGAMMAEHTFTPAEVPDLPAAIAATRELLRPMLEGHHLIAIGHRVVHGGPDHSGPVIIDNQVLKSITRYEALAPLHQPNNLAPIRLAFEIDPTVPQVACFDTAFHRGHPQAVDTYALPQRFFDAGIRRYGFHGLSYEYIATRLREAWPNLAAGRVIVAHLGSGASMCALADGRSIETTMGFTALDGIAMGTRPGQLDPGVVLHLITAMGMSPEEVTRLLYHEAGLKGLSGIGSDMRTLLASDDPRAHLAIDHFVHRVALMAGQLTAALGGLDGMVFTAGIGENAPVIRARIVARLGWLGAEIDTASNSYGGPVISTPASRIALHVIPTDEELMIARHTLELVGVRQPAQGAAA